MRHFNYQGWHSPDIVQDENGQVWVSIYPPARGLWNPFVEIEVMQSAKGYSFDRGAHEYPTPGSGTRSGRSNGDSFRRPSPESQDKYGIRDHRPMNPEYAEQARLYLMSQGYDIDPEELRKLL